MSKATVWGILQQIERQISSPTNRNNAVPTDIKLLLTLRYYATGSVARVVSDFCGVDRSTGCRIIHQVSHEIAKLRPRSYGVWKRRFPILVKGINMKLEFVEAIIVATSVLHNIAMHNDEPQPEADDEVDRLIEEHNVDQSHEGMENRNSSTVQQQYISYFENLI
ncbi:hypothetical protein GE061_009253 [Apolygus lucorum]|uniref:DDE Tnp4 domain-containing protein n=1 Tax=Apolygus lucorum TaxID=248454 RepID=A0A6A4KIK2_APOLU|nr:hypothetical protein GE061_009253 [Apolygus lucorum]